jgi:hypothetical protein
MSESKPNFNESKFAYGILAEPEPDKASAAAASNKLDAKAGGSALPMAVDSNNESKYSAIGELDDLYQQYDGEDGGYAAFETLEMVRVTEGSPKHNNSPASTKPMPIKQRPTMYTEADYRWDKHITAALRQPEKALRVQRLLEVHEKFEAVARRNGSIIFAEIGLDAKDKTIKPAGLGGVAGGDKVNFSAAFFCFLFCF